MCLVSNAPRDSGGGSEEVSNRIFENMPVITHPENSCDSRVPPNPPRPHDRAKSHPHSSPRDIRRENGRRSQTRRATISEVALPETASNRNKFISGQGHVCCTSFLAVQTSVPHVFRSTVDFTAVYTIGPFISGHIRTKGHS